MRVDEGVMAGLKKTNALFETAVREQKFDLLDQIYTRNARILPPGAPMTEGRDAIRDFWRNAVLGMGIVKAELSSVDVQSAGDGAVEIGRGVLTLSNGQTVRAKYVVHWEQEDGQWKWQTDIWNMNE